MIGQQSHAACEIADEFSRQEVGFKTNAISTAASPRHKYLRLSEESQRRTLRNPCGIRVCGCITRSPDHVIKDGPQTSKTRGSLSDVVRSDTQNNTVSGAGRLRHVSVLVVALVILDAFFVLAELLIDLSVIQLEHGHVAPEVFHYLSLALLTFFMVELAGKLFAYRLEFFQHKFEVFDGLVVVVSFVLDVVFIFHEDAFDGMGLLILLRLWRVARIINGILVSVKNRADQKIHKLKESYDHLVQRASELQERCDKLEQENQRLRALLKEHGADF
ncbi:hypothetical protein Q5P01_010654 [Channa striata]|uniref:Voltage-gated hydrogen channel 1 n=1 Tax=Channa striata TaxID=64152 RepID=A0AA88MVI8_CHASR|nr:hypothetical protein Q5P01_010654 [Channa striata]